MRFLAGYALALCWLAALSRPALADDTRDLPRGQSKFRVFGGADGLNNLSIGAIAQDGDGLLWLGTDDGVYRFDGERFTHFSLDDGLLSSAISSLGVAPSGEICVGSKRGLACWNGARFSQAGTEGLPAEEILTMASAAGTLWAATDHALYVRRATGGFVAVSNPRLTVGIHPLWVDDGGLVVANGNTVELRDADGAWRNLGDVGLGRDRIAGVLRDRHGALWIRTARQIWCLARGARRAADVSAGLPTGYVSEQRIAMALGPRGDIVVAAADGISYRDGEHWRTIDGSSGKPGGIVQTLFVDRDGAIWMSAAELLQLRGGGLIEHYDMASGLPGEIVWTFARDATGAMLVGTNRCLARATAGQWRCVPGTEDRMVSSVVFAPRGGMFLGGTPPDILYLDEAGHATSIRWPEHPKGAIHALVLGPEGDLWIGTGDGMFRMPGAVPGAIERVALPDPGRGLQIRSMAVVGDRLWASVTPGGVLVHDRGTWHLFSRAEGLRDGGTNGIFARSDGRLCAGYEEALGVSCFGYDGHGLTGVEHIGPPEGLVNGMSYLIGEDAAHRLWIGTGAGLDIVTRRGGALGPELGIDHLDVRDGIAGNDAAANAFLRDRDDSLWFGSSAGATHVFAPDYRGPPPPPRAGWLGGRLGDVLLRSGHHAPPRLEIPHDRSALNLELVAGSLVDPRRISYQVRLLPREAAWSTTHQREVRYPALLPDAYRFEVRARIDVGEWGPVSQLAFTVLPAWWQTSWFIAGAAIAGLLVIGAGFTWRQRIVLRNRTRLLNQQSDASFRAVIDLIPELISVYRDDKLIYPNLATRRLLGIEARDGRPQHVDLVSRVHPEDLPKIAAISNAIHTLDPHRVPEVSELRMRGADGSWRTCEVSGIRVEIGGAPTVVTSGRDVTERKRMQAKMLVSDRMASLGTLAAGVAHEINNPLAYVTGNLEVIAETLEDAAVPGGVRDELFAVVNDARDGAERVRKIVSGLRSFTRSEEEKRVPLDLGGVLEAAIRFTSNEIRHRAQLVRAFEPTPIVLGDDGQLTQVVINLLVNAAHAIPEGPAAHKRVTLRARTDSSGHAVIEVEDTGTGMTPEVQARVFDPFFTTKGVGEGTGLGLSICHGIISGLRGQILIESPPEHRIRAAQDRAGGELPEEVTGTLVRVVLPPYTGAMAARPTTARVPTTPGPGGRRYRVLLVDDEPLVVATLERLLRNDYDVTTALSAQDAMAHIASGKRFDVIVSDVMMPTMSGIELSEELQRLAPDQAQRLIFLSGGVFTAQTRERLQQLGAPQLAKPIAAHELRAWVMRIATDAKLSMGSSG